MITKEEALAALEKVKDPELNMNIVDLGLVYSVDIDAEGKVAVDMTLTSPGCPVGPMLMEEAQNAIRSAGAEHVQVNLVWEPTWNQEMMSERLKKLIRMGIMRF